MRKTFQQSTRNAPPGKDAAPGASAGRVLRVLLAFGPQRPTARVDELARAAGVPLSSAYRYVALLRDAGLLADAGDGAYQITPRVIGLAQAARLANGVHTLIPPALRELRDQTGESALFLRRAGDQAVCADLAESSHAMRLSFSPGHPMPLHAGAGAKLLLAGLDADSRAAYVRRHAAELGRPRRTRLTRELPLLARQGWATSEAEVDDGVWAAAARVDEAGHTLGVITVAGPAFRLGESRRQQILASVRAAAARISEHLGALDAN